MNATPRVSVIIGDPVRVTPPAALPLTLAELKAQTRVTSNAEDALMLAYLRAAVEYVEQYTGLALITQTWRQTFSAFGTEPLVLRRRPLQEISSVGFLDSAGDAQTLASTVYAVAGIGADKTPGSVRLGPAQAWPTILDDPEAVTVTYVAGFGDTHNDVPELIRHALMLIVATWYNQREDVVIGSTVAEMPNASKVLLQEWRPAAVA